MKHWNFSFFLVAFLALTGFGLVAFAARKFGRRRRLRRAYIFREQP